MAKCLRYRIDGRVDRVSDELAHVTVENRLADYISKSEYKAALAEGLGE